MTVQYLLPCTCGEKVPVEPRQAGQVVSCRCGASLQVPTMLKLASLERVQSQPTRSQVPARWGWRQRMTLVAALLLLGALGSAAYLILSWPTLRVSDPETIRNRVESLSPAESFYVWQRLRGEGLTPLPPKVEAKHAESVFRHWFGMGAAGLAAACGIGLMIAAWARQHRPVGTGRR